MITFMQLGNYGRLGNQLFQYAALKSLCLTRNVEVGISNFQNRTWHGQKCLLNNFNIEAKYVSDVYRPKFFYSESDPFKIDKDFFYLGDGVDIRGFFQSLYYFENFSDQIKKELTPKNVFIEEARREIDFYRKEYKSEIVSIHVRRGDNTDNTVPSQKELNNFYCKSGEKSLDSNSKYSKYINEAMSKFNNVKFLVFTGGGRGDGNNLSDIEWCKNSFLGEQFIFSENKSAMQDFSLIMSCDHNILSHVSSFGWWAAYLNNNKGKVVAPLNYHPDIEGYTHREKFYPDDWILI